jgi:hypothetical protein
MHLKRIFLSNTTRMVTDAFIENHITNYQLHVEIIVSSCLLMRQFVLTPQFMPFFDLYFSPYLHITIS